MKSDFNIEGLADKCRQYENIYCYGAGEYGKLIFAFLKSLSIKVKKFIVSNDNEGTYCDIPIVKISSLEKVDLDGSLIILSLGEVHHLNVINLIRDIHSGIEVYPVTQSMIESMPKNVQKYVIINDICERGRYVDDEIPMFEKRLKDILHHHNKIQISYMYATQIGVILLSWMYYNEIVRPVNDFLALFPFTKGRQINNYLMSKMSNDCVEVIAYEKIGFWKYVLENYPDIVSAEFKFDYRNPNDYHSFFKKINVTLSTKYNKSGNILFDTNEVNKGESFLKEYDLREYVCIFARDSRYTKEVLRYNNKNFEAIDYYRDLSIDCFDSTAKYLHEKEINTVRMGSLPGAKSRSEYIFDYGNNYRTEFLDVFLFSRCKFFLGTPSGIQYFADLYCKPMVMVNVPILSTEGDGTFVYRSNSLMIIQKYWDNRKKKYLTIKDMLRYECTGDKKREPNAAGRTLLYYSSNDIIPVKNTTEEILAVTREMIDMLEGKYYYDDLDKALYEKYEQILNNFAGSTNTVFPYRLGREFLRENQWLLE